MNRSGSDVSVAVEASHGARVPEWVVWALFAALAAPIGVIVHELGHFAAAHAFGFPDVVLHYGHVSDGAAASGAPAWQQAIGAGAGPLVTLTIVILCCLTAWRIGPRAWVVAPAFAAGVRSIAVGAGYAVVRLRAPAPNGDMDELNFARGLGLSPDAVMAASTLLLLLGWAYLVLSIPQSGRKPALLGTAAGTALGLGLYVLWVGPLLLP